MGGGGCERLALMILRNSDSCWRFGARHHFRSRYTSIMFIFCFALFSGFVLFCFVCLF